MKHDDTVLKRSRVQIIKAYEIDNLAINCSGSSQQKSTALATISTSSSQVSNKFSPQ